MAIGEVQPNETKTITSAVLTLSYHPQHIYIYVAEDSTEYNDVSKAVRSTDTFAQLNKISITYGNNTKLMDEFDEHYLYQTALYNGLTDTTFADTGVINSDFDGNKVGMTGLALKITPGIDPQTSAHRSLRQCLLRNIQLFRRCCPVPFWHLQRHLS